MKRILVVLAACGGGAGPECPTGSCTLPASTVVKWMFDHYPERQFQNDSCTDLGVSQVEVDLTDAKGKVTTQKVSCDYAQVTFVGLVAGDYTITMTPLDAGGASLINAPISGMVTASDQAVETTMYVPWDAWTQPYTGTFLFRVSWGGQSCAAAMPAVQKQALELMIGGNVVAAMTDSGEKLDGMDWVPCRALTDEFPQSVTMLPFGPATLVVEGKDAMDNMKFTHSFDVFVGAGISNPTVTYDVPAPAIDAGVDAPGD